jgi:hypothetical protein
MTNLNAYHIVYVLASIMRTNGQPFRTYIRDQ